MKKGRLSSYDTGGKALPSMCAPLEGANLRTSYKPKENYFAKGKAKYPSLPKGAAGRNPYA